MSTTSGTKYPRLKELILYQEEEFERLHPRSKELYLQAKNSLLSGVPMHWMIRSAGTYPIFAVEGQGSYFTDVDGLKYLDFALGDTGAMTGHSPAPIVSAIQQQLTKGCTFMLPTTDSIWVAEELQRRFGLPLWQFSLTATDANRFCIRIARHLTHRPKILIFNYCYHGTVDETFTTLHPSSGKQIARAGNIGPPVDPTMTTVVIEFNDVEGLEAALSKRDIACVLAEPAMTNIGIILPHPHYHTKLRELTRKYGSYLIIDETHTICASPGGYTQLHQLTPDFLVLGKPLGGGIPIATYGFTHEIGEKLSKSMSMDESDTGGIGGTMAGNALSLAAAKATLQHILTNEAYVISTQLAQRFDKGVKAIIEKYHLPWVVQTLGCRSEFWFRSSPPSNGGEAAASLDHDLDYYFHIGFLNHQILLTPFHNMVLISPYTTEADIDYTLSVFDLLVKPLVTPSSSL